MTRDPVRLLDDPGQPDVLRDDLAEAANQPLPGVDMALGLATLAAAINASGGGAAAGAGATAKAAALAHGSWWGGALVGAGAGLVVAVGIWFAPPLSHPPAPRPAAPIKADAEAKTKATAAAPIPAPIAVRSGSDSASPPEQPASPAPRLPSAIPAPAPAPALDSAEELGMLVRIKQQAASDPAAVVALVDEGHRRFPRGSFYQERESIAILALAQLGRSADARARAQRFLDAHPESPYAERLRGLVATPRESGR